MAKSKAGDDASGVIVEAMTLSRLIQPLLRGRDVNVIGIVLVDLVSIFFAGHPPEIRDEVMAAWIDAMKEMIPEQIKEKGIQHGQG
jgi:hypothetical protein